MKHSPVRAEKSQRMGNKTCNDDELVKHMSNLPGFLQRAEKKNSIQEKALNFGVLDWNRLEKWKYNERMPGKHIKKTSSLSSNSFCSTNGPPKTGTNLTKQTLSNGPSPSSLYSVKPMPHGSRFSSPQRKPSASFSSRFNSSKEERKVTYHREEKYAEGVKSKGKESCQAVESRSSHKQQDNFHQRFKLSDRNCSKTNVDSSKRKVSEKETISEKEASSSDQCKYKLSLSSHDKISAVVKESEKRLDDYVNPTSGCCTEYLQNGGLLIPEQFPEKSCSETSQFVESSSSLDGQLTEVEGNRLSDCFSPLELYSGEFSAEIPHSCPLPSNTKAAIDLHMLVASQGNDFSNFTSECQAASSHTPAPSEGKNIRMNERTTRPSLSLETLDKTQADFAEQPSVKGRTPSPTRRFSFNLGRMSRSFSFKESSAVPRLSAEYISLRSGPVRPEVPLSSDKSERDKAYSNSRGRSSPLRRLLDPLLKYKGAQSAEAVRHPSGSLHAMTSRTTGTRGPSQDRKPVGSTFQALLQLTLKNGLPVFKLVVDNSSEMLAAAVKRLPKSGKSDSCLFYAFYSVHEVRKKSMNWISQGSKSKICSLGYNIVGQMKISSSHHPRVNGGHSSQSDARECVLYGVDPGNGDKQTPEVVPNKEIAAIVIEKPTEVLYDKELFDNNQLCREKENPQSVSMPTFDAEEIKKCSGMVVLLPGGDHGVPIKGAPSSLISRWRSGGSCDCGGWDVGCKLRILSDERYNSSHLGASTPSSVNDHLTLFLQGEGQRSKPVLRLEPFNNDFHSIQLDTSISLLEAFATCVAYFTCRNFSEILDVNDPSDAENRKEPVMGIDRRKTTATFQEQVPAKYVTCPPLSPVGRI